jgi:2,4-dichlorophenol 6-monooxygenase
MERAYAVVVMMADLEVPVLIVGGGPSGLMMSNLLSSYGTRHMVIERRRNISWRPKARAVNQRTAEIFRYLGLGERLLGVSAPCESMGNVVWFAELAGLEVARVQGWGAGAGEVAEYRTSSPCPMLLCAQPVLEELLLDSARTHPEAELRFGQELLSFTQDGDGVTATVLDRPTQRTQTIRAGYLIGADGARSGVVRDLGLELDGRAGLGRSVSIWFDADLSRYLAHRPGFLYFNVSPTFNSATGPGVLLCNKPWHDFVLSLPRDETNGPEVWGEEFAVAQIRRAVGEDIPPPVLKGISGWEVDNQVATRYSAGRVFCVGDAVRRHAPNGGLGLNTSLADTFNLAWKLAAVLADRAGPPLLESYSAERQPVGRLVADRARDNYARLCGVQTALESVPGRDESDGWRNLEALEQPGPRGDQLREALREALARTDYQFKGHGVEHGYRYRAGARVPDGTEEPSGGDPVLCANPTTWPGAHLPHAWLERPAGRGGPGCPLSTLDLVRCDHFTLLTGLGGENWVGAAQAAARATGTAIDLHLVGSGDGPRDPYGEWRELRGVESSGAVLVRPDQHVAWRQATVVPDAAARLTEVMRQLMALSDR